MSRDKRDAERAARRAKRLAERAEERARRKEKQAERAASRAERLAERAQRRPSRDKDLDQSIEDLVDEVTQKAEAWINEQTESLFDSTADEKDVRRAERAAEKARQEAEAARKSADKAGQAAEDLDIEDSDSDFEDLFDDQPRKRSRRGRNRWHGNNGFYFGYYEWPKQSRARARRRRTAHLYRDRQRKKILGVCAGVADYFGRPTWEIRLYAVLGLIFIPSVTVPSYFITYFFMDNKPYYRRVTDRFEEDLDTFEDDPDDIGTPRKPRKPDRAARGGGRARDAEMRRREKREPPVSNVQAMKTAKDKFSDIEQRLRQMESHVTSSRFELQRELKKISGED